MFRDRGSGGTGKACGTQRETFRLIASAGYSGSSNWLGWRAESNATPRGQERDILCP